MATGFELRVRRLIDIGPKPINWSNSSPFQRTGGEGVDAFRFPPPCVRGCVCHQTARPCLKFRAIQPWNIDIPCQRSRIPQGRHQRTLFATDYIHRRNMYALLRYLPDKTRNCDLAARTTETDVRLAPDFPVSFQLVRDENN